jgi:hypothetical protein
MRDTRALQCDARKRGCNSRHCDAETSTKAPQAFDWHMHPNWTELKKPRVQLAYVVLIKIEKVKVC